LSRCESLSRAARFCRHAIPEVNVFLGWEELAAKDKLADAVVSLPPPRFLFEVRTAQSVQLSALVLALMPVHQRLL
jgi:hypothetical protein